MHVSVMSSIRASLTDGLLNDQVSVFCRYDYAFVKLCMALTKRKQGLLAISS